MKIRLGSNRKFAPLEQFKTNKRELCWFKYQAAPNKMAKSLKKKKNILIKKMNSLVS